MFIWLIKEILIYCHCYSICHPGGKKPTDTQAAFLDISTHRRGGEGRGVQNTNETLICYKYWTN